MATGRRTRLERLAEEDGLIERPLEQKSIRLHLDARLRSGNMVLRTVDLAIGYRHQNGDGQTPRREDISGGFEYLGSRLPIGPDDNLLFRSENIELKRGERAALLGPNGAGKSTFLKTIMGNLPPLSGKVRVGASVHLGYLAQAHSDLRPDMTVLNAILEKAPRMEIGQARSFLGRFLFSGDDVSKPISSLSGGQRSRVALARLTLEGANLLLLDEPTNHLDIQSQEVLEDVLRSFPGTVLLVTHDRYLVDAVATQVWMIDAEQEELRAYPGNYSDYLAAVQAEQEAQAAAAALAADQPGQRTESQTHRERGREDRRQRKAAEQRAGEADRLLRLIEGLEQRIEAIGDEITQASSAQNTRRVQELGVEYQAVEERLHQLMEEWAEMAE